MRDALVTVLINNCNYARFLASAIDSALAQTYRRHEVIVVDDGSTDDSRACIRRYGNAVVPVFKSNGGQASALNAGFAVSRGELVFLLDADDVWVPTKLETMVALAHEHPDAICLSHKLQVADIEGRPQSRVFPKTMPRGSILSDVLRSGGCWTNSFSSGTGFRRAFLERVMPMPTDLYRVNADLYLLTVAPFVGELAGCDEALGLYRIHGSNQWHGNGGRVDDDQQKRRMVQFYRAHLACVNRTFAQLDLPHRVREEDHWLMQLLRRHLREGPALPRLIWNGLRWKGQMRFGDRLKGTLINTVSILRSDFRRHPSGEVSETA